MEKGRDDQFIPCTREITISADIVYRPIRSWHAATFAGEGLKVRPGYNDRSGCLRDDGLCRPPYTVTHRLYWNKKSPTRTISAFLSYPSAMGCSDSYFWEAMGTRHCDVERFFGDKAEAKMERKIIRKLRTRRNK